MFNDKPLATTVVKTIEDVVIGKLHGADEVLLTFVANQLSSKYPYLMCDLENIKELWSQMRNTNQSIVDWTLDTLSTVIKEVGGIDNLNLGIELYAESYGLAAPGSNTNVMVKCALQEDTDLNSRLVGKDTANLNIKNNPWFVVILALFALDIDALEVIREEKGAKAIS